MVYLITYDINTTIKDYSSLYAEIKNLSGDYQHPLESVWLISTNTLDQVSIYKRLRPLMSDKDYLLIARFSNAYFGWLSNSVWEWLKNREI